ncbi:MAG TPA: outer membrane lipoprotein carrier protein LolA [Stellaceae bacterium]|nr:outer membrane lipoprotein carrier protein LolA [Stellaceae bacterium]
MSEAKSLSRRQALYTGMMGGMALAGMALPTRAAVPKAAVLNDQDYADVKRVQEYLNGIRSVESRFDQVAADGGTASGTFYLSRPGKMRINYDPPVPVTIVADGWAVYYWDKSLQQLSQIGVEDTPAWFLLRDTIRLGGDVTLTRFERSPGIFRLTLLQTEKPDIGSLTMVLTDHPLALRQWTVIDAQKRPITVTLIDPHFDINLNPDLFVWVDPRRGFLGTPR